MHKKSLNTSLLSLIIFIGMLEFWVALFALNFEIFFAISLIATSEKQKLIAILINIDIDSNDGLVSIF